MITEIETTYTLSKEELLKKIKELDFRNSYYSNICGSTCVLLPEDRLEGDKVRHNE